MVTESYTLEGLADIFHQTGLLGLYRTFAVQRATERVDDAAERAAVAAFRDLVASDRGRAALEDAGFEFLERTNE